MPVTVFPYEEKCQVLKGVVLITLEEGHLLPLPRERC